MGLEPTQPFGHKLLRLTRLPIPPLPQPASKGIIIIYIKPGSVKTDSVIKTRPGLMDITGRNSVQDPIDWIPCLGRKEKLI